MFVRRTEQYSKYFIVQYQLHEYKESADQELRETNKDKLEILDVYYTSYMFTGCYNSTLNKRTIESLSNEDGNVNENVVKQWFKLQNTITARANATIWPLFRRHL